MVSGICASGGGWFKPLDQLADPEEAAKNYFWAFIMTRRDAIQHASEHLSQIPPPGPNYRWIHGEPRELTDFWYFDYKFEHVGALSPEDWDQFGGSPGFVVSKLDGQAVPLSWEEYRALGLSMKYN